MKKLLSLVLTMLFVSSGFAQNSQAGRKAYVYIDNGISVLDSTNNSVVVTQTIPVNGALTTNFVTDSLRARIYAGGVSGANTPVLWIVNTVTNALTSSELPAIPNYLAINPAGTRLYVLHGSQSSDEPSKVFVIDANNYAVLATVPVSAVGTNDVRNGPLAVNPSGTRVYVNVSYNDPSCPCRDTDPLCPCGVVFSIIDTANNSVVDQIRNDNFIITANQLLFSPDGLRLYATISNKIRVIAIPTNIPIKDITIGQGNNWMVINSAGSRIYAVTSASNSLYLVDPNTEAVLAISVGVSPLGVALGSNGNRIYVTNNAGNSVSVIDLNTNALVTTVGVGHSPTSIAIP